MTETKEPSHEHYVKIIERLKSEKEELKKRVKELEKENSLLKGEISKREDIPLESSEITRVEEIPPLNSTLFSRKEEIKAISLPEEDIEINPLKIPESVKESEVEIPIDYKNPVPALSSSKKPIIEGYSRRQCPHCDNDRQMYIQEQVDKTNIIMLYPRIYGKKYKCGKCGGQWKLSPKLE